MPPCSSGHGEKEVNPGSVLKVELLDLLIDQTGGVKDRGIKALA